MKKSAIILTFLIFSINFYSQEVKNETETVMTKINAFSSKTGVILKFIDYSLLGIKATSGLTHETKIRKVITGGEFKCFYNIELREQYKTSSASIAYDDLIELIKALTLLKIEAESDLLLNPDYLENKFVTDDGFSLGYYVSKGKVQWYLTLDKYSSGTIYIKNVADIEPLFISAKQKMEELNTSK